MLVDRPPQVMRGAVDFDEDLVEVPCVAGLWSAPARLVGVCLPEFGAPSADRFVADYDTAFEYRLLDLAEAEREPQVHDTRWLMISVGYRWPLCDGMGVCSRHILSVSRVQQRDSALGCM